MRLFEDREMTEKTSGAMMKEIDEMDYALFVKYLGDNANDQKLKAAIASGLQDGDKEDDVFDFTGMVGVAVRGCKPTQNEVVLKKSLSFPLPDGPYQDKANLTRLMSSNSKETTHTITKDGQPIPIVIFSDGTTNYVIDGHHRWSQVHAVNPDAYLSAFVMTAKKAISAASIGTEILKAVQLSILKVVQDNSPEGGSILPFAKGGKNAAENLFECSEADLKKYVVDNVGSTFLEVAVETKKIPQATKEAAADYIWKNVLDLRDNSQPIVNATLRELMPQTDGGEKESGGAANPKAVAALMANKWMDELESGKINHTGPYESQKWIKTFEQYRRSNK